MVGLHLLQLVGEPVSPWILQPVTLREESCSQNYIAEQSEAHARFKTSCVDLVVRGLATSMATTYD